MFAVHRAYICLFMCPVTCAHVTGYQDSCSIVLSLHLSFPVSCNTRTCYRLLRLMFHNPTVPAYLENGFLKKLFLWLPMGWPCLQHSGMLPVNRAHICLLMYPATCALVTGYKDSCSKLLACICGPACSIPAC